MELQGFSWCLIYVCLAFQVVQSTKFHNSSQPNFALTHWKRHEGKIINGTEAQWEGTRHQVSVRLTSGDWLFGAGHICGGALISPNTVLTAAHCIWSTTFNRFRNASDYTVVMGNLNRYQQDNGTTLVFGVSKLSVHREFNATSYANDVAILQLDGRVPANFTRARVIPLNHERNLNASNTVCQVSGWGRNENGVYSPQLMVVDVAIVNRNQCAVNYGELVRDGMICAGYMEGGRDACVGDSGGPLVCGDQLVGVVSFGVGCARPGYPGVYADVASYVPWINNQTKSFEDVGGFGDDGVGVAGDDGVGDGGDDDDGPNYGGGVIGANAAGMRSCVSLLIMAFCCSLLTRVR